MGKRKRGGTSGYNQQTNQNVIPCSSGTELLSGELLNASQVKPLSPGINVTDNTLKLLNMHSSLEPQHHDVGRSVFLKRSRHYYGHHYSRRNSGSNANASTSHRRTALSSDRGSRISASTSHGRIAFLRDSGSDAGASTSLGRAAFLSGQGNHAGASTSLTRTASLRDNSLKLIGQSGSNPRHTDKREIQFRRPESVRFSSLVPSSASTDAVKMVCGICDKPLRRKPYFPGETPPSSGEFSVVAVLACGHVYHADCLEERTSFEERQEPSCAVCMGCMLVGMVPQVGEE